MTLLHCEGFDSRTANMLNAYAQMSIQPTLATNYGTGRFGSGSALQGSGSGSGYIELDVVPASPAATIITGTAIWNSNIVTVNQGIIFSFYDSTFNNVLQLRNISADKSPAGQVTVVRGAYNAAGTVLGTSATVLPSYIWAHIEIKVTAGTGTSGSVVLKQNGVETLNLTGIDTGSTSIGAVGLAWRGAGSGASTHGCVSSYDDWWVCNGLGSINNDFLGDCRVLGLVPIGPGSLTQFTPSTGANWQCLDEIPPATSDYVGSNVVGAKDLYDFTALGSAYQVVKGARLVSYAVAGDAGTVKGRNICKLGANTANGIDFQLSPTAQVTSTVFETDPSATGWTNSALNSAEFGWEVRS